MSNISSQGMGIPQFQAGATDIQSAKVKQLEEAPVIVQEPVGKREPPTSLPPMPQEVPPKTPESENLTRLGDQVLKLAESPPKEKGETEHLSEKIETAVSGGGTALSLTSKGLDASTLPKLEELTQARLELSAAAIEEFASAAEIGMDVLKLFENNQTIKGAQAKLYEQNNELETLKKELVNAKKDGDETKAAFIEKKMEKVEKEIEKLTVTIEKEIEKKKDTIQELVSKSVTTALTGTQKGTGYASEVMKTGTAAVHATAIASSVTGSVLSVVTIALTSKAINDNRQLAVKINTEKASVLQELEKARGEKDGVMTEILELRLRNLDQQLEENTVNTVKNAITLTAGVLGTAAAAKAVALAVGATIAVGLGTAVTATGIGAIVLGSAALLIGGGYLVYKNRHAIGNKLQNVDISRQEWSDGRNIRQLQNEKTELRDVYESSTQKFQKTLDAEKVTSGAEDSRSETEKVDDLYRDVIDSLSDQITTLKKEREVLMRTETNNPLTKVANMGRRHFIESEIAGLQQQIRFMAEQKTLIALERAQTQKSSFTATQRSMDKMLHTDVAIHSRAQDLRDLNTRRNEINETYKYGKDVAKFGKNDKGEEFTAHTLGQVHSRLFEGTTKHKESLAKMEKYFLKSCGVAVELEGANSEKFWEQVLKGVTAPVK
jgi:hypothetical protein